MKEWMAICSCLLGLAGCLGGEPIETTAGGLKDAPECKETETICVSWDDVPDSSAYDADDDALDSSDTATENIQGGCSMSQIRWAIGECRAMRARYGLPPRGGINGCYAHSWGLELWC